MEALAVLLLAIAPFDCVEVECAIVELGNGEASMWEAGPEETWQLQKIIRYEDYTSDYRGGVYVTSIDEIHGQVWVVKSRVLRLHN
jgi:hypothetical protein